MKVAVFSTNLSFFGFLKTAFTEEGHELRFSDKNDVGLVSWADVVFFEFCQEPMWEVLEEVKKLERRPFVVARMHRIEMYNGRVADKGYDWSVVDILFPSAEHVCERFIQRRAGGSKPKQLVIAATNLVDQEKFMFVVRKWQPPYRICLAGNFVPKKRQYSAIQMMYDVKKEFGKDFRLDIVGSRGLWGGYGNFEYYDNCVDLIEDLGLRDVVTIYEPVPHNELQGFYAREHIILSNSNEEGTHVAISEGIATGCVAFCNWWRGVDRVYPSDMADHFRSPVEFVELCRRFHTCGKEGKLHELSGQRSESLIKRYGDLGKVVRMVRLIVDEASKEKVEGAK